jgi:uncharacterized protein (TIGR02328 family)
MRLWHQDLINKLPSQQLLGQHREICALRGLAWNKRHRIVNYVFEHPYEYLFAFHLLVIAEMEERGYHVDELWKDIRYRGKRVGYDESLLNKDVVVIKTPIYCEHNEDYLKECIMNLHQKGVDI